MKLYTNCNICKNEIRFSTFKSNRLELYKSKGVEIKLNCKQCGHIDNYHLNQIKATKNKMALMIGLIIFLVGTPMTLYFIWDFLFQTSYIYITTSLLGMTIIPFTIYSIIEKEQRDKIKEFNNIKLNNVA